MENSSVIPSDYTFLDMETFVSVKAKNIMEGLIEKADNRNPDDFDMYIYNDFFTFGVLDLVDRTLATLHGKIKKKDWDEAYYLLEGLVLFVDVESVWTQCNDGERVRITNQVIGAASIAVFRGLQENDRLHPSHFPSLENLLKNIFTFGAELMPRHSDYRFICKAIARRLFANKTKEDFDLEIQQVKEWINGFDDKEERKELRAEFKKAENEKAVAAARGERVKAWYAEGKVYDEDDTDPDFKITRVWKEYKEYLQDCPRLPLRGPQKWDLSKWTAAEKRPFEFATMDEGF